MPGCFLTTSLRLHAHCMPFSSRQCVICASWRPRRQLFGSALVRLIPVVVRHTGRTAAVCGTSEDLGPSAGRLLWYGYAAGGLPRARVLAELEAYSGTATRHIRYPRITCHSTTWFTHAADIDKSKVVWPRELETRNSLDLLRYFQNRRAWLVEPDSIRQRSRPISVGRPKQAPKPTKIHRLRRDF